MPISSLRAKPSYSQVFIGAGRQALSSGPIRLSYPDVNASSELRQSVPYLAFLEWTRTPDAHATSQLSGRDFHKRD
jgi:hypothetical protein